MKLTTWIFPEHSGVIPGIPGLFPGGSKIVIDEDTNSIYSFGPINQPVLPEESAKFSVKDVQEVITPGYNKEEE